MRVDSLRAQFRSCMHFLRAWFIQGRERDIVHGRLRALMRPQIVFLKGLRLRLQVILPRRRHALRIHFLQSCVVRNIIQAAIIAQWRELPHRVQRMVWLARLFAVASLIFDLFWDLFLGWEKLWTLLRFPARIVVVWHVFSYFIDLK